MSFTNRYTSIWSEQLLAGSQTPSPLGFPHPNKEYAHAMLSHITCACKAVPDLNAYLFHGNFIWRRAIRPHPWWCWLLMISIQPFCPPSEPACPPSRPSPISSSRCVPCPPVSCHRRKDNGWFSVWQFTSTATWRQPAVLWMYPAHRKWFQLNQNSWGSQSGHSINSINGYIAHLSRVSSSAGKALIYGVWMVPDIPFHKQHLPQR